MVTVKKLLMAIAGVVLSMAIAGAVFSGSALGLEAVHTPMVSSLSEPHIGHSPSVDPRLNSDSIFYGEEQTLGDGTMRTWVKLDKNQITSDIGVSFTEAALSGLPKESDNFGEYPLKLKLLDGRGFSTFEYQFLFPKQASATPFTHISLNWNPHGHAPEVYTAPHLDFHFNMISPEERFAIKSQPYETFKEKAYKLPTAGSVPKGYVAPPQAAETHMGVHWIDLDEPEFHGEPWEKSFIYGFYDGKMVFWEPMFPNSFLEKKPNITTPIKQPPSYPKSGYYPTAYSVNYANGEYTVSLNGLTFRSSKLASVPEHTSKKPCDQSKEQDTLMAPTSVSTVGVQ